MKRRMIAIQSSNPKFWGLTLPEWVIGGLPMPLYVMFTTGGMLFVWIFAHLLVLVFFGQFIKKFGEDIVSIFIENRKIENIIKGTYNNPLPISEPENTSL